MQDGYEWNDNKAGLICLTKACKLKNDEFKTRFPIQIGLLEMILFETNRMFQDQPYFSTLYKAFFAISYYGLFRVGELAKGIHQIKAKDIHIADNKNKILMVLHSSKTHGKYSRPQKIEINEESTFEKCRFFCLFNLMRSHLKIRGGYLNNEEPLFLLQGAMDLSPDMV